MNVTVFILLIPTVWEVIDDRKSDSNKGFDVFVRVVLGIAVALWFPNPYTAFFLAMALHFFLFDYAINIVLGRQPWFAYLGKRGVVDNVAPWRNLHPTVRFIIRAIVLVVAVWLFIKY
jgi:hypothetical protein